MAFQKKNILLSILAITTLTACNNGLQPQTNAESNRYIDTLYRQGRQYNVQNKPDSALYCFLLADKLINKATDVTMQIRIQSNLGLLHAKNMQYAEALSFYHKALRLCRSAHDSLRIAYAYNDIGRIHILNRDFTPDKTLDYFNKATVIYPHHDDYLLGDVYQNKGMYYHYTEQTDSALHYLMKSIRFPAYGCEMAIRYSLLGHTYLEQTLHLDSAKHYLQLSLNYPKNTLRVKNACNNALYKIAQQEKDSVQAHRYASIAIQYKDAIMQQEDNMSAQALNLKESQKQELAKKHRRNSILLITVIICCIGFFIFAYKQRQKRKQITIQNQLLENTITQNHRENLHLKKKLEQVNEQILQKVETEEGRVLELRRQMWVARLKEIEEKAKQHNIHSKKQNEYIRNSYNDLLQTDNWEAFSTLINQDLNNLIRKITKEHYKRDTEKVRSSIRFCVLLLLEVPQEIAEIVLDYNHPDVYRTREKELKKRFKLKPAKEEKLYLFLLKLMQQTS